MAFTRVNPGDPIHASQLDQVIDALDGAAGAGQPIAMTALNDATNYALTVQNDEPTNSRALNVLKSDGTNLIRADATGVTLGAPLNLPTGSITSTYILDGTIQNVDIGPDVARANQLVNGGFDINQRGGSSWTTGYMTDRWLIEGSGLSVSLDGNAADVDVGSQYCLTVTASGTFGNVSQFVEAVSGSLRGRTISGSIRVKTTTANAVRLTITSDGTSPVLVTGAYHPGGGTYQTLTAVGFVVPPDASHIYYRLAFSAACTAYVDNATLVVGSVAANYVPLTPADELARCLRYYEVLGQSGTTLVWQLYGPAGGLLQVTVPYKAVKAVTPTVTKIGSWTVTNCAQPSAGNPGQDATFLQTNVTAAGMAQFYAATAPSITVEANP